jgi:hypothetical protein
MLIYDEQDVRVPRSAGMHESGLACKLDCMFPTQSTSPIPGLVRFLAFCALLWLRS